MVNSNDQLQSTLSPLLRRFSSMALTCVSLAACADVGVQGVSAAQAFDPTLLQAEFAAAHDLELAHSVDEIPPDIRSLLSSIDGAASMPLADLGMEWSHGDSHAPGLPTAQHRFSATNDRLALVVFVVGGSTVRYQAILAPRHSRQFCLFNLGSFGAENMRLSALQRELDPERHEASPKAPECLRRFADN